MVTPMGKSAMENVLSPGKMMERGHLVECVV